MVAGPEQRRSGGGGNSRLVRSRWGEDELPMPKVRLCDRQSLLRWAAACRDNPKLQKPRAQHFGPCRNSQGPPALLHLHLRVEPTPQEVRLRWQRWKMRTRGRNPDLQRAHVASERLCSRVNVLQSVFSAHWSVMLHAAEDLIIKQQDHYIRQDTLYEARRTLPRQYPSFLNLPSTSGD